MLTPYTLRSRFVAVHHDVYLAEGAEISAVTRAQACWLWSRRQGVVAGFSAAALHGSRWIDATRPAQIIYHNRHPPAGVRTWADQLADDEIAVVGGICVTTPARTALDLARRNQLGVAVSAIDALGQATDLKPADVELLAQRYRGRRGIARARVAVDLVDTGAESPKETWLRLLLIRAGLPRPQTQIAVRNVFGWIEARVDMGWEELKVAAEYDGDQHRSDRRQFVRDVHRLEFLERAGWIVVRVVAEDHPDDIVRRVRDARARARARRA